MDVVHRRTELADLEFCLPLLCEEFAYSPEERVLLLELWRHLIREKMCESAVVEDRHAPVGERIVGFGMSVFVNDAFCAAACDVLSPFLAKSFLTSGPGYENAVLAPAQVRRANAERTLNVLILHSGWAKPEQAGEAVSAIRRTLFESLLEHHCGYGIHRILIEAYGKEDIGQLLTMGWRLESDYSRWATDHATERTAGKHPSLLSMRRDDVQQNAYHLLYRLFHAPPPRFFFRTSQRALLQHALTGKSDARCAEEMDITIDTVQKRWRSIYGRVYDISPGLISPPGQLKRGGEKRTELLRYVRAHPEELRPWLFQEREGAQPPKRFSQHL